ncbi:hypothetical protein BJY04DRAFT_135671 [Aspergillus karnatakaensis]|uniref:uncharacterized protein n=1 Tax=Aspergillus karnatakaensis TaxID=1810916 RepID=UPI003CCD9E08
MRTKFKPKTWRPGGLSLPWIGHGTGSQPRHRQACQPAKLASFLATQRVKSHPSSLHNPISFIPSGCEASPGAHGSTALPFQAFCSVTYGRLLFVQHRI